MTINDVALLGIPALGMAGGALVLVIKMTARLAKMEERVDTLWQFQMRRAMSEVVEKGLGTMNSPLQFTADVMAYLLPIKDDLVKAWHEKLSLLDDAGALLEIEREFGERLFKFVCIPCKLTHGACLILALAVASQRQKVDLKI